MNGWQIELELLARRNPAGQATAEFADRLHPGLERSEAVRSTERSHDCATAQISMSSTIAPGSLSRRGVAASRAADEAFGRLAELRHRGLVEPARLRPDVVQWNQRSTAEENRTADFFTTHAVDGLHAGHATDFREQRAGV